MYIYPDSEVLCTRSYFQSEDVLDKGSSSFKPSNELAILQSIVISDIKKNINCESVQEPRSLLPMVS